MYICTRARGSLLQHLAPRSARTKHNLSAIVLPPPSRAPGILLCVCVYRSSRVPSIYSLSFPFSRSLATSDIFRRAHNERFCAPDRSAVAARHRRRQRRTRFSYTHTRAQRFPAYIYTAGTEHCSSSANYKT